MLLPYFPTDFSIIYRKTYNFGVRLAARGLVTLPDSTSQKFLLLGLVSKRDQKPDVGAIVVIYLDFSKTRGKKCTDSDYEKWYARPHNSECLIGHKVCHLTTFFMSILICSPAMVQTPKAGRAVLRGREVQGSCISRRAMRMYGCGL